MDYFKRNNTNEATCWDWNCHTYVKRKKGDTKKLHKLSRKREKEKIKNELKGKDKNV